MVFFITSSIAVFIVIFVACLYFLGLSKIQLVSLLKIPKPVSLSNLSRKSKAILWSLFVVIVMIALPNENNSEINESHIMSMSFLLLLVTFLLILEMKEE